MSDKKIEIDPVGFYAGHPWSDYLAETIGLHPVQLSTMRISEVNLEFLRQFNDLKDRLARLEKEVHGDRS